MTHEFTPEERVRGGSANTLNKAVANSLRRRKRCTRRCYYFDTCPLMAMSQSSPEKKCAMRAFPEKIRRRFEKVFLGGEDGLINEITTAIYHYGLEVEVIPGTRGKKEFIEMLFQLHKAKYGEKRQASGEREPLNIHITQLNAANEKETKEIPDSTVKPVVSLIEDPDQVEDDPESLFGSEKLEEIIRSKNEENPCSI